MKSKDVVMDLTKLFEYSLMEEFNDLMSANVKSMSVDNTSEWWAQRTRLNTKMMVRHLLAKCHILIIGYSFTVLYKTVTFLLLFTFVWLL